jgi:hypothetical protein
MQYTLLLYPSEERLQNDMVGTGDEGEGGEGLVLTGVLEESCEQGEDVGNE